ncbi:MAG: hypothetical protein ACQ9MH_20340 [Nitrospinales bacterium]
MIIDTFTFFNELDLLEIRLNILDDIVDQFILVEATKTFQNKNKPLFFHDNKERFAKFHNKLSHVVVEDMPDSEDTRLLESHQRNAIARGLLNCRADDQIILSDLDEIPNPKMVAVAAQLYGVKAFEQKLYYYFLNQACVELAALPWSIMCEYEQFETPQEMRNRLISLQANLLNGQNEPHDTKIIKNGGWHFSYLGGINTILTKLRSFADPEYNKPKYCDITRIKNAMKNGTDLFGRNLNFVTVPIDDRFPEYIRMNKAKMRHLLYE